MAIFNSYVKLPEGKRDYLEYLIHSFASKHVWVCHGHVCFMVCFGQGEAGTDKAFVQGKIPGNLGNPGLQLIDSEHGQLGVCTLWHHIMAYYDWFPIIHSRIFVA